MCAGDGEPGWAVNPLPFGLSRFKSYRTHHFIKKELTLDNILLVDKKDASIRLATKPEKGCICIRCNEKTQEYEFMNTDLKTGWFTVHCSNCLQYPYIIIKPTENGIVTQPIEKDKLELITPGTTIVTFVDGVYRMLQQYRPGQLSWKKENTKQLELIPLE